MAQPFSTIQGAVGVAMMSTMAATTMTVAKQELILISWDLFWLFP